jgi:hypothetical protein
MQLESQKSKVTRNIINETPLSQRVGVTDSGDAAALAKKKKKKKKKKKWANDV